MFEADDSFSLGTGKRAVLASRPLSVKASEHLYELEAAPLLNCESSPTCKDLQQQVMAYQLEKTKLQPGSYAFKSDSMQVKFANVTKSLL